MNVFGTKKRSRDEAAEPSTATSLTLRDVQGLWSATEGTTTTSSSSSSADVAEPTAVAVLSSSVGKRSALPSCVMLCDFASFAQHGALWNTWRDAAAGRLIVLDTETTGLERTRRLVEIAAVEVLDMEPTGHVFHRVVNASASEGPHHPKARQCHNITAADEARSPNIRTVLLHFLRFCLAMPSVDAVEEFILRQADSALPWPMFVGHNIAFDVDTINGELSHVFGLSAERCIPRRKDETVLGPSGGALCTRQLFATLFPQQPASLPAACRAVGLEEREREDAGCHGALIDTKMTCRLMLSLISHVADVGDWACTRR